MKGHRVIFALIGFATAFYLCFSVHGASGAEEGYEDSMFRRALRENSTAPLFVLISVNNTRTCTLAPFLLGAVQVERKLPYGKNGAREAIAIAMGTPERAFSFSNPKALSKVKREYSDHQLRDVRAKLANFTRSELKSQVKMNGSSLQSIYSQRSHPTRQAYKYAVAHVLLENGILVGIADRTGALYLP